MYKKLPPGVEQLHEAQQRAKREGPAIQAIPTEYAGVLFRSRLEAKWAEFFDDHGIAWAYEEQSFDLGDSVLYLPDFWLPEIRVFFEVKGVWNYSDVEKVRRLAHAMDPEGDWTPGVGWNADFPQVMVGMSPVGVSFAAVSWKLHPMAWAPDSRFRRCARCAKFTPSLVSGDWTCRACGESGRSMGFGTGHGDHTSECPCGWSQRHDSGAVPPLAGGEE